MARVLIACEKSGVVRRAFERRGHDAWSCDIMPPDDGSNRHITGDVRNHLADGWDLLAIMHPPCTRLCNSGVRWLYIGGKKVNGHDPAGWAALDEAADFYRCATRHTSSARWPKIPSCIGMRSNVSVAASRNSSSHGGLATPSSRPPASN
jgi:hypothetical protein